MDTGAFLYFWGFCFVSPFLTYFRVLVLPWYGLHRLQTRSCPPTHLLPILSADSTCIFSQGHASRLIVRYCAKNEFEPIQVAIGPASGSMCGILSVFLSSPSSTISVTPFGTLGPGERLTMAQVGFTSGVSETLAPVPITGSSTSLSGSSPVIFWITVFVPASAPAGTHSTTVTITVNGSPISIPLNLYVFNFAIPGTFCWLFFDAES